jgi:hypothetical protein
MNLIEVLRTESPKERPPKKQGVSAYLSQQQYERLEMLAAKAGNGRPLSHSRIIGRLIDLAVEQLKDG